MSELLVGRDEERARLDAIASQALDRAVLVLIEGPAGIGKSMLVRSALDRWSDSRTVWVATVDPLEADRPFGAVLDALRLWSLEHDGIGGARRSSLFELAADARYRLIDRICASIEATAAQQPVVLVIEDLHAADSSVPMALRKVRERLAAYPILVLATSRPAAVDADTERLLDILRDEADAHIRLQPLDDEHVSALALHITGGATIGPRLAAALAFVGGTPLLVREYVAGLQREGLLLHVEENIELPAELESHLPHSVAEEVRRRQARLDDATQELVRATAVLGATADLADAAAMLEVSLGRLRRPLREAIAAGLLQADSSTAQFHHEIVRLAVYENTDRSTRRWLHHRAASVIAQRDGPAATVAVHLERSESVPAEEIREWHVRAAEHAIQRSPATAERLYRRAIDATTLDDPRRAELAVAHLGAAAAAGMLDAAQLSGEALLAQDLSTPLELATRWWLGGILVLRNRVSEAADMFAEAASRLTNTPQGAQCLAMSALCLLVAMDRRTESAFERALAAADAFPDPVALTVTCMVGSRVRAGALQFSESLALARRGLAAADADVTLDAQRYQPHFLYGNALLDSGDSNAVLANVEAGRRKSREIGTGWAEALYEGQAAVAHYFAGRLDEALVEAISGLATADDVGVRSTVPWCHAVSALVHLHRGEPDLATAHLCAAQTEIRTTSGQVGHDLVAVAEARSLYETTGLESAREHLHGAWELMLALHHPPMAFSLASEMMRFALLASDLETVTAVASEVAAWERIDRLPWLGWLRDVAESASRGRADVAALPFDAAIVPLAVAGVAVALAKHAAKSDPLGSSRLVRDAERVFHDLRAYGDLAASRALMPGANRRGRPRRTVKLGWQSLTETERLVAGRIAEGRSNREIAEGLGISVRTTETHVGRILQKLGVPSRLAVAALSRDTKAQAIGDNLEGV